MTNIKKLIKQIEEMEDGEFKDSLYNLACDADEDQLNLVDEVYELRQEVDNLEDQETEYKNSIDLGLDTIHFTFEKGNLQIRQQFDTLMQLLCKTPNALI